MKPLFDEVSGGSKTYGSGSQGAAIVAGMKEEQWRDSVLLKISSVNKTASSQSSNRSNTTLTSTQGDTTENTLQAVKTASLFTGNLSNNIVMYVIIAFIIYLVLK